MVKLTGSGAQMIAFSDGPGPVGGAREWGVRVKALDGIAFA